MSRFYAVYLMVALTKGEMIRIMSEIYIFREGQGDIYGRENRVDVC
jgi:hypothetical protein